MTPSALVSLCHVLWTDMGLRVSLQAAAEQSLLMLAEADPYLGTVLIYKAVNLSGIGLHSTRRYTPYIGLLGRAVAAQNVMIHRQVQTEAPQVLIRDCMYHTTAQSVG